MIGLDTNVVVRVMTRDDAEQASRAAALIRQAPRLHLSKTVLLETAWVLRHTYSASREVIHRALDALVRLHNLEVEDPSAVTAALAWYAAGLDFADAMHLASSGRAAVFATFDQHLRDGAEKVAATPQVQLVPPG